jgi:hypothetical protein
MPSPNLIQLAPTLSAEERYRLVVPDMHRELMGEKPLISESERQAITHFEDRKLWEEYTGRICMLQWAQALWPKDVETEKLRVIVYYLELSHSFDRLIRDGDQQVPKGKRAAQFETLKAHAAQVGEQSVLFYAYREAFEKIKQELCGVPLLNEKWMADIVEDYTLVDEMIEHYNGLVRKMCAVGVIRKTIGPIVRDMENYLVKKPMPDAAVVERIVDEIRHIAGSEMRMLGR